MSFINIIINLFTQLMSFITTLFLQLHPTPNSNSIELQNITTVTSNPFQYTSFLHTLAAQTSIQAAHYCLQLPSHSSSCMCFWVIHADPGVIIHCGTLILLQDLNSGMSYHGPLLQHQLCSNGWSIIKLTGLQHDEHHTLCIPSQYVALAQSEQVKRCIPFHQCPEYLIQYLAAWRPYMQSQPGLEVKIDVDKYTEVDEVVKRGDEHLAALDSLISKWET